MTPLGVGVIGMGFMGRTHAAAYGAAAAAGVPCRLVAVCDAADPDLARASTAGGNLETGAAEALPYDPTSIRTSTRAEDLLADPSVHAVSICTPTDTHAPLAIAALQAGKHVLIEKPVAIRAEEVRRVADAARGTGLVCMPAMCMRFWPGWDWLRDRVRDGQYGRIVSAVFTRLGSRPDWSASFYGDPCRSGGALGDLHVHDADAVRWLFGDPESVTSTGTIDHVTTLYRFRDGPPHVVAEGGWDHAPGFPFTIRYTAVFEHATATFDLARPAPLHLARDGRIEPVQLPAASAYEREIREFLDAILNRRPPIVTIDDALGTAALLEAERTSLQTGSSCPLQS